MEIFGKSSPINLKAYNKNVNGNKNVGQKGRTGNSGSQTVGKVSVSIEDKVMLSPNARNLQSARARYDALPEVRAEKVAMVKSRIEEGEYKIDGEKIAEKMIKDALLNDLLE